MSSDNKIEKHAERIADQNKIISNLEIKLNNTAREFQKTYDNFIKDIEKINNEILREKRALEIMKEQKKLMEQVAQLENKMY
jgi:hypothetical protein